MQSEDNRYQRDNKVYLPKGRNVLVELEPLPPKKSILYDPEGETLRERYLQARAIGKVLAISPTAFTDDVGVRCKVGDMIAFKPYSGTDANRDNEARLPKDETLLRWLVDFDIMGVVITDEVGNE